MKLSDFINEYPDLYNLVTSNDLEIFIGEYESHDGIMYIYPKGYHELYVTYYNNSVNHFAKRKFGASTMIFKNITRGEMYTFVIDTLYTWKHYHPFTPKFLCDEIDARIGSKLFHQAKVLNAVYTDKWVSVTITDHKKNMEVIYDNVWFITPHSYKEIFEELEQQL